MTILPIGIPTGGAEWKVGNLDGGTPVGEGSGKAFGSMLTKQLSSLQGMQDDAAKASQGLADGTAPDATSAVMAVERARLSMQMASQMRTKGVEALNDVFHTQV